MASTDRPGKIRDSFQVWVWNRDASGDNILRKGLRALVRICLIVWREIERDRINLRAAALTYTVLLSLVPTLLAGNRGIWGCLHNTNEMIYNSATSIAGQPGDLDHKENPR